MCTIYALGAHELRRGFGSLGTGIADSCEWPGGYWDPNSGCLCSNTAVSALCGCAVSPASIDFICLVCMAVCLHICPCTTCLPVCGSHRTGVTDGCGL